MCGDKPMFKKLMLATALASFTLFGTLAYAQQSVTEGRLCEPAAQSSAVR